MRREFWSPRKVMGLLLVVSLAVAFAPVRTSGAMKSNALIAYLAVCAGIFRLAKTHPRSDVRYRQWLQASAWNGREAPPKGPVHLTWQDALAIGVLTLPTLLDSGLSPAAVPAGFLSGWLVGLWPTMLGRRFRFTAYTIAFGLGTVMWFFVRGEPFVALATAGLLYVVGRIAVRRDLLLLAREIPEPKIPLGALGAPFQKIGPAERTGPCVGLLDGVLIGVMTGWWVFVALSPFELPAGAWEEIGGGFMAIMFIGAVIRFAVYKTQYAAPLTLMGRIRTWRWVMPQHDIVYAGPIVGFLIGCVAIAYASSIGATPALAAGIGSAMLTATLLVFPPDLETWRLTGSHRVKV